ncbi:MAG: histidinol dehydrogenase, partial [Lachnospiraceae bacterium]|nr:histidinol dehydrogenase [Lachnospiraceae bacterium]
MDQERIMMEYLKKGKERTKDDSSELRRTVSGIIDDIIDHGDAAVRKYSEKFDG